MIPTQPQVRPLHCTGVTDSRLARNLLCSESGVACGRSRLRWVYILLRAQRYTTSVSTRHRLHIPHKERCKPAVITRLWDHIGQWAGRRLPQPSLGKTDPPPASAIGTDTLLRRELMEGDNSVYLSHQGLLDSCTSRVRLSSEFETDMQTA